MKKSTLSEKIIVSAGLFLFLTFILVLILALSSVTISALAAPLFSVSKALILDESSKMGWVTFMLVVLRVFTLLAAAYLVAVIISVLSTISTYSISKINNDTDDEVISDIVFRGLNWSLYRMFHVFKPVLIVAGLGLAIMVFSALFFNAILGLAGINMNISVFLSTFIAVSLLVSFLLAVILSLWTAITTIFGIDCTVSEPELSNNTIMRRSERMLFAHKKNWKLIPLYLANIFLIASQMGFMLIFKSYFDQDKLIIVILILSIDIILFFSLNYLKYRLYQDSMQEQFKRIIVNRVKYSNS